MPKDHITTHYVIGDVHGHADWLDKMLAPIYCERGQGQEPDFSSNG